MDFALWAFLFEFDQWSDNHAKIKIPCFDVDVLSRDARSVLYAGLCLGLDTSGVHRPLPYGHLIFSLCFAWQPSLESLNQLV